MASTPCGLDTDAHLHNILKYDLDTRIQLNRNRKLDLIACLEQEGLGYSSVDTIPELTSMVFCHLGPDVVFSEYSKWAQLTRRGPPAGSPAGVQDYLKFLKSSDRRTPPQSVGPQEFLKRQSSTTGSAEVHGVPAEKRPRKK